MWRALRIVLLACVLSIATALPAAASPAVGPAQLGLTALWSKVLETPDAQNPFGHGGIKSSCLHLAPRLFSAFGPSGAPACTIDRGTTLVVSSTTNECSTFEVAAGTNLRKCAEAADAGVVAEKVTVDGKTMATPEVETALTPIVLPRGNLFGLPAGAKGAFVGHGWVAIVKPLPPGRHIIHVTASGTDGQGKPFHVDDITIIIVRCGPGIAGS